MLSHKSGVFVIDMAAEGFVQFEEPRIISVILPFNTCSTKRLYC